MDRLPRSMVTVSSMASIAAEMTKSFSRMTTMISDPIKLPPSQASKRCSTWMKQHLTQLMTCCLLLASIWAHTISWQTQSSGRASLAIFDSTSLSQVMPLLPHKKAWKMSKCPKCHQQILLVSTYLNKTPARTLPSTGHDTQDTSWVILASLPLLRARPRCMKCLWKTKSSRYSIGLPKTTASPTIETLRWTRGSAVWKYLTLSRAMKPTQLVNKSSSPSFSHWVTKVLKTLMED